MSMRTIAPRAAVAVVFLGLGATTLGVAGHGSAPAAVDAPSSSYLIVADANLLPAFAALDAWLKSTGRSSLLINLGRLGSDGALCSSESQIAYLRSRGLKEVDVVVLGGVEAVRRLSGLAPEKRVVQARVATPAQARSYVRRIREDGVVAGSAVFEPASAVPGTVSSPPLSAGALP
jgi:hypothetical protein